MANSNFKKAAGYFEREADPDFGTRDFYRAVADGMDRTDQEPEALPLDTPDWDWPDAPDPRVNDRLDRHLAWGWLALCALITLGSLAYLASTVQW